METDKEERGTTPQVQLEEEDVPLETSVYHSIKVSNLNSFMYPWLLSFKPGRHRSRIEQRRRGQRIGVFMHTSDVVILQECWGSQVGIIQRCLDHHKVIPSYESHNLCGLFENTINNIRCYLRDQGGLWAAYNSRMKLLYFAKRTFTITETSHFRGCHAFLLDMEQFWKGKYLLVVNAHLDCKDRMKQRQQMQELHTYLGEFIQEIKIGNPDFAFRQCGVVLAGDFNSPSYSTNYHHLIDLFAARDLYKEYIVKHQKDEKPSYDPSSNSLIDKDSFPERIDYIFGLDRFVAEEPEFSSSLASREELKLMPLEAIKFQIHTQTHGEELGDHWPLSADIVPRENIKSRL